MTWHILHDGRSVWAGGGSVAEGNCSSLVFFLSRPVPSVSRVSSRLVHVVWTMCQYPQCWYDVMENVEKKLPLSYYYFIFLRWSESDVRKRLLVDDGNSRVYLKARILDFHSSHNCCEARVLYRFALAGTEFWLMSLQFSSSSKFKEKKPAKFLVFQRFRTAFCELQQGWKKTTTLFFCHWCSFWNSPLNSLSSLGFRHLLSQVSKKI